jgi:hypothetical protein
MIGLALTPPVRVVGKLRLSASKPRIAAPWQRIEVSDGTSARVGGNACPPAGSLAVHQLQSLVQACPADGC